MPDGHAVAAWPQPRSRFTLAVPAAVSGPVLPADSVTEEQLQAWKLSRAQFEAYNGAAFEAGRIPEVAPPEVLA